MRFHHAPGLSKADGRFLVDGVEHARDGVNSSTCPGGSRRASWVNALDVEDDAVGLKGVDGPFGLG